MIVLFFHIFVVNGQFQEYLIWYYQQKHIISFWHRKEFQMYERKSSRVENNGFIRKGDGKYFLVLLLLACLGVATFVFGIDYELCKLGGNKGVPLPIIGTGMILISILLSEY